MVGDTTLASEEMERRRKVGTDSTRLRMLDLFYSRPRWTAKELGEELGVDPNRLYYHLRIMEEAGAIAVVDKQAAGRMVERIYSAANLSQKVTWDAKDPQELSMYMAATLESGKATAENAIYEMARQVEEGEKPLFVRWGGPSFHATQEDMLEFDQRINDLLKEFIERAKGRRMQGEEPSGPRLKFAYVLHEQPPTKNS